MDMDFWILKWVKHSIRALSRNTISVKNARKVQIYAEQVKLATRQTLAVIVAANLAAVILAYMLWDQVPAENILGWLGLVFVFAALTPALRLYWYRRSDPSPEQAPLWGAIYTATASMLGASWGVGGVMLFATESLMHQVLLMFTLVVGAATTIASGVPIRSAFYGFLVMALIPTILRTAWEGDSLHLALSGIVLVFMGTLLYFYQNWHHNLVESLTLRLENVDLVQRLKKQKTAAEQANQAKSRFLAATSHDLRQPVQAQVLFVAELRERIKDPELQSLLDSLEASTEAVRELLNGLLDISKLDAGTIQANCHNFAIKDMLDKLRLEYNQQAQEKGLKLRVVPSDAIVFSDSTLLTRILRNLVSNAVRYTESGGVIVGCRCRCDRLRIEVRDSGVGIPEDQQQAIFQEFYQLGNLGRNREMGLGLGLAIVDRLASLLDCRIVLKSTPGKGSIFAFELPKGGLSQAQGAGETLMDLVNSDIAGARVLIIDDEAEIRRAICGLLQGWRCQVLKASCVEEALQQLAASGYSPEVIVCDYRLRDGENGLKAIARIQTRLPTSIPAILITGDTSAECLREVSVSGYRLLHKPVQPARLRALLGYELQQAQKTHATHNTCAFKNP